MTIKLNEYRESWHTHYAKKLYKTYEIEGENEVDCFKKIYTQHIRPSRYCNDVKYDLETPDLDKRFHEWCQHGVTIEMYYGNGTVD